MEQHNSQLAESRVQNAKQYCESRTGVFWECWLVASVLSVFGKRNAMTLALCNEQDAMRNEFCLWWPDEGMFRVASNKLRKGINNKRTSKHLALIETS